MFKNDDGPAYEAPKETRPDAYATLLATEAYAAGAEALLRSLAATGTKKARVALVTPSVGQKTRRLLVAAGATDVVEVAHYDDPHANARAGSSSWRLRETRGSLGPNDAATPRGATRTFFGADDAATPRGYAEIKRAAQVKTDASPRWAPAGYTKLRLWELDAYAKVVYFDADCLVQTNVDELFDRCRDVGFAAAPALWPPDAFDAGVLVLAPSRAVAAGLQRVAADGATRRGGATHLLNDFFDDWFDAEDPKQRLPFKYNWRRPPRGIDACADADDDDAKIVHFAGDIKPWSKAGPLAARNALETAWWAAFEAAKPVDKRAALDFSDAPFVGFKESATSYPGRIRSLAVDRALLETLPDAISTFGNLVKLTAAGNRLRIIPVLDLPKLEALDLADNILAAFPGAAVLKLPSLRALDVRRNKLVELPKELADLKELRDLPLAGNPVTQPPPAALVDAFAARARAAGRGLRELADALANAKRWRFAAAGSTNDTRAWLDGTGTVVEDSPLDRGLSTSATLRALLTLRLDPGQCVDPRDFMYVRRADILSDRSRRRRARIFRGRVAAAPRLPRGYSAEARRRGARSSAQVPPGVYLLDVLSLDYVFSQIKLNLPATAGEQPRCLESPRPHRSPLLSSVVAASTDHPRPRRGVAAAPPPRNIPAGTCTRARRKNRTRTPWS